MENVSRIPLIGDKAPEFNAVTTNGSINFPQDYGGKWVILFSHPADFTPVCTTEIATFAAMHDEFKTLNCELVGLSVDSNSSHLAWIKEIEDKISFHRYQGQKIEFPIIADFKGEIAAMYGMLCPEKNEAHACRSVFFIDPVGIVRAIIYYPQTTGRNFAEIKRVLQALQTTDKYGIATPADWNVGDDVLISAPKTKHELDERIEYGKTSGAVCNDWFFCTQKAENMSVKNK